MKASVHLLAVSALLVLLAVVRGAALAPYLPLVDPAHTADKRPRDCFVFFIHEAKVRAPAGAVAFLQRTDR